MSTGIAVDVSEVEIRFVKQRDGLVGIASCVVDGRWHLRGLGVYTRRSGGGYRVTYPTKILRNGQSVHVVHPINGEAGAAVERAISKKVSEILSDEVYESINQW